MKIGVFQAHWPIQIHTVALCNELIKAEHQVELFLFDTLLFEDLHSLDSRVRVHLGSPLSIGRGTHWFSLEPHPKSHTPFNAKDLLRGIYHLSKKFLKICFQAKGVQIGELISVKCWQQSMERVKNGKFDCLVGIEKQGLIWAGTLGEAIRLPVIYYNLELYTRRHKTNQSKLAKRIKHSEEYYHKRCAGTWIQAWQRAEILFRDNEINAQEFIEIPVSLPRRRRKEFYNAQNVPVTILQFGKLAEDRLTKSLVRVAQYFPGDWKLLLHGWGSQELIKDLIELDKFKRVEFSLDRLPSERISEIFERVTLSLVLYSKSDINTYLTAFASEKLALSLREGVPVICFRYPGYEVIEKYGAGVLIEKMSELPRAIHSILNSLEEYRSNALRCFEQEYCFERHYSKIDCFLQKVSKSL